MHRQDRLSSWCPGMLLGTSHYSHPLLPWVLSGPGKLGCSSRSASDLCSHGLLLTWPAAPRAGAYYGTTFPHLMLMTYPMYRPPKSADAYVPRVFGFKLHPTAYGNR